MPPRTARALLLLSAAFALFGGGFWLHAVLLTPRAGSPTPGARAPGGAEALQSAFVAVADHVRPAVVHIGTIQVARPRRPPAVPGPFADDPAFKDFFDQFFGRGGPRREEFHQPGLGSGGIIDRRGGGPATPPPPPGGGGGGRRPRGPA